MKIQSSSPKKPLAVKSTTSRAMVERGKSEYEWASSLMKVIIKISKKYQRSKPLSNFNLGVCLHITKETSVLIMAAKALGAQISICSANPLSIQAEIIEFLRYNEINVFAKKDPNRKEFYENIIKVSNTNPHVVIDDGAELHSIIHQRKIKGVYGGTEETTSGILRILSLQSTIGLDYPIIGVNNAKSKYFFDNRYGTGQSTVYGVLRTLGILIAGKRFVVCGYGWVGRGVSSCLRGLGAMVTITEVDPIKALEAHMDGFNVQRLEAILPKGDCFITCTGQKDVISRYDFDIIKNGAFLANAGHFDVEIDVAYLYRQDNHPTQLRPNVESFNIKGKKINLIAKGRVINLVGGEGNSPEVMDLSFSNQLLSILFILKNDKKLGRELHQVPKKIDDQVAHLALSSFGIKIDKLTRDQVDYQTKTYLNY